MSSRLPDGPTRKGVQGLQKALKLGLTVVSELWSYSTGDWVSSVHAADIDGDGDVEILLASRDCNLYVLTKRGALKWKLRLSEEWVGTVRGINYREALDKTRIVAGARDNNVHALDESGKILWSYKTSHVVRQVRVADINQDDQTEILIGSEDRFVYALSSQTGEVLWKYATNDWVRTVHAIDIDQDGEIEVLAGSGDKYLYVLDSKGQLKTRYNAKSKIYSIFAADIDDDGKIEILIALDSKELRALTTEWREKWCFRSDNRILSLSVIDLNNDGRLEIVAASEDKHIYFLNNRGKLIWKHNINSRVFSVHTLDIDDDGVVEILAGTEDSVHVLRFEPSDGLHEKILSLHKKLGAPQSTKLDLLSSEIGLIQDITNEWSLNKHQLTMEYAIQCRVEGEYLQALATFVLLKQQRIQVLWSKEVGHVRAVYSGDLNHDGQHEIVAGTDEGDIYVFDASGEKIWSYTLNDRIWTVYVGDVDLDGENEIVAGSATGQLYMFSNVGVIKWQPKLDEGIESVYINEVKHLGYAEMVVGLRGTQGKLQIYNNHFESAIEPIVTPHGIRVVGTHDLNGDGIAEIIAAGDDDNVYVYTRYGKLMWSFRTGDRARGLSIKDIDMDGQIEIVVGSEDRNVHVLDSTGNLKWRYYTPHRVLSVNTEDVDLDGETEVFLGTDDGYIYFLSKTGDLLWKYKIGDRVRGVQAADCNLDGKMEIIVGSDDRMLHLIQVLRLQEITDEIEHCWAVLQQQDSVKELIYKLAHNSSAPLRMFALTRITKQSELQEGDVAILHALVRDASSDVRCVFAQEMARLYQIYPSRSKQFLDILSEDNQERDVRLALVDSLSAITHFDWFIGFQYLERFSKSVDGWVRRSVVRKLYDLAEAFPQRVFRLLLHFVHDDTEWVRQETARTLAHYFDLHPEELIKETRMLITQDIDPLMLKFIASCSTKTIVQNIYLVYADLLLELNEHNILQRLENVEQVLEKTRSSRQGEEIWQVYHEFYRLHRLQTIDKVAHYTCEVCQAPLDELVHFEDILQRLRQLRNVTTILATYMRRERLGDRLASLLEATEAIQSIYADSGNGMLATRKQKSRFPDYLILEILLSKWLAMVVAELAKLRGKADLKPELHTKSVHFEEQVGIWLDVRNEGSSPADNISVRLKESDNFEIVGKRVQEFETISTAGAILAEFVIRPKSDSLHLIFEIIYADAEAREKVMPFGDRLELRNTHYIFERIPNPYSIGTPIKTREMFYGRQDDLDMLKEDLTCVSTNMVVVLYGQRRSGKSSLLYQLSNNLSNEIHIPVYIDMQHEILDISTSRLLYHLAFAIARGLKAKNILVDQPDMKHFIEDPIFAFDQFMVAIETARERRKLIIMIDEFEFLEQKVIENVLAPEIFEYLRSLMQHGDNINFLLAGTHTIEQLTQGYWSVFFNIARHHWLSKLSEEAAKELITIPIDNYVKYDPFAVEKIKHLTANQPYLIQLICRALVMHCNELHKNYITINDVNTVLDRVMETGQVHFKWLWGQTSLEERLILAILAEDGADEGRSLSLSDIEEVYKNYSLQFQHDKIMQALERLVVADIIESVSEGTRFKVPTGLIRRWLREAKSLRRVMLEENLLIQ